jgi:hypothetical protein
MAKHPKADKKFADSFTKNVNESDSFPDFFARMLGEHSTKPEEPTKRCACDYCLVMPHASDCNLHNGELMTGRGCTCQSSK